MRRTRHVAGGHVACVATFGETSVVRVWPGSAPLARSARHRRHPLSSSARWHEARCDAAAPPLSPPSTHHLSRDSEGRLPLRGRGILPIDRYAIVGPRRRDMIHPFFNAQFAIVQMMLNMMCPA